MFPSGVKICFNGFLTGTKKDVYGENKMCQENVTACMTNTNYVINDIITGIRLFKTYLKIHRII